MVTEYRKKKVLYNKSPVLVKKNKQLNNLPTVHEGNDITEMKKKNT